MKKLSLFIIAALLLHAQHSFCASQSKFKPEIRIANINGILKYFIQKDPTKLLFDEELIEAQLHLKYAKDHFDSLGVTNRINAKPARAVPDGFYEVPYLVIEIPDHLIALCFTATGILNVHSEEIIPYDKFDMINLAMFARANRTKKKFQAGAPDIAPHVPSSASKIASIALKFLGDRPIAATIGALDQE